MSCHYCLYMCGCNIIVICFILQASGAYIFRPNSSNVFPVNVNGNNAKIVSVYEVCMYTFHLATCISYTYTCVSVIIIMQNQLLIDIQKIETVPSQQYVCVEYELHICRKLDAHIGPIFTVINILCILYVQPSRILVHVHVHVCATSMCATLKATYTHVHVHVQYMSIKSHHTVTLITLVLL